MPGVMILRGPKRRVELNDAGPRWRLPELIMSNKPNLPPDNQEELVHADDAIIGKAARCSLVVLVLIAGTVTGTVLFLKRKPAPVTAQLTRLDSPVSRSVPEAEVPLAAFTDI